MRTLVWSTTFVRAFKRAVRRQPELRVRIEHTLKLLAEDPFHPMLHSHKKSTKPIGRLFMDSSFDYRAGTYDPLLITHYSLLITA